MSQVVDILLCFLPEPLTIAFISRSVTRFFVSLKISDAIDG
jgi:hypothetical protein